jgi:DUF3054 family protein
MMESTSPDVGFSNQRYSTTGVVESFHCMNKSILILGDLLAIALVTIIGFATHGEAEVSFLPRMAALYIPLAISWFLLAPSLGIFQREIASSANQLWRPALAMIFAASLAAVLRGFMLNAPVIPIFAGVLALVSAFGMALWRTLYFLLIRNK